MCRAAEAVATENPCAAPPPAECGELGFDEGRHRREIVGYVVNKYLDLDAIGRFRRVHWVRFLSVARGRIGGYWLAEPGLDRGARTSRQRNRHRPLGEAHQGCAGPDA